jgi:hypothetical protein
MSLQGRKSLLRKKAKRGFRGYPAATVTLYGPDDQVATKVAVGIIDREDGDVVALERWFSDGTDIRLDHTVELAIVDFIRSHAVHTVVMTEGIFGCPHEEVVDYPEGTSCPRCPYWAGRDRATKERLQ